MSVTPMEPKRIWWAPPRKLCALERPGGGGRSHRRERRAAEVAWLQERGVRLIVSTMAARHNLSDYDEAGLAWHHVPVPSTREGADPLDELLQFLDEELRRPGVVAVHGDHRTDFVAALCAAHLHELRGTSPVGSLVAAARAGLDVTPEACALLGVDSVAVQQEVAS